MKNSEHSIKKNKRFFQTISIALVLIVIYTSIIWPKSYSDKFKNELSQNGILVNGTVDGFKQSYKLADALKYHFYFNEKIIYSKGGSNGRPTDYYNLSKFVVGKSFPVIISPNNPYKYSKLLIVPEDFEEYGLKFPDSLNWVMKYVNR